jgi:hypothetical protein
MALLLLVLQFAGTPEPDLGAISGRILEAQSQRPLAGAAVQLPDLGRSTVTDSLGRYALGGIPAGPQHLSVRLLGFEPRTIHALVPRHGVLEINVTLAPRPVPLHAIEVRAPVALRQAERGTTEYPDRESSVAAMANHPLLAEPDALHALGGGEIVLNAETPGGMHIRGAPTDQTAYQLDGVPIFSPYHAAGLTTAWNTDALSRVTVWDTDPAPAPSQALSGTVEGVTRTPGGEIHGQGALSTTQLRLTLDGPVGIGGAGFVASARAGLHDVIAPGSEGSYLAGGVGDWLGKLEAPALGGRWRALWYGNTNAISTAAVAEEQPPFSPRNQFDWEGRSFGVEWRREIPRGGSIRAQGWGAEGDIGSGWAMPTGRIAMDAERRERGAALHWEQGALPALTSLELRLEQDHTSYHVVPDSAGSRWDLDSRAPLATLSARVARQLGAALDADLGMALSEWSGQLRGAPRAQLGFRPLERLVLSGTYLRSYQYAQSLRNTESVVEHVFPADATVNAGTSGIPVAVSDQEVLAVDWRFAPGMRLGVQGYDRRARGMVLVAPRDGEPFSTGAFAIGSGKSHGVSMDLSAASTRWAAVASYGWQHVRYEYGDSSYVPEHGAAHLLQGGMVVYPTASTSVRLGADAAMGRRATVIPGAFEWESCNLLDRGCEFGGSPHYGDEPLGALALPPYARVDLAIRQHWHVRLAGRDARVALFGSYTNLLSRHNLLTYSLDPATGERVEVEMRPASPLVMGLDWRF